MTKISGITMLTSTISSLLLTALVTPGALAAPLLRKDDTSMSSSNTATCSVSYRSSGHGAAEGLYKVHVGRPFNNGSGCADIKASLEKKAQYIVGYMCVNDGKGQTELTFSTVPTFSTNIDVVEALQAVYPMVPFEAERICLQEGNDAPTNWPSAKPALNGTSSNGTSNSTITILPRARTHAKASTPSPNTATCSVGSDISQIGSNMQTYSVSIGRPFIDGAGCDPILDTLHEASSTIFNYACQQGPGDTTTLSFGTYAGGISQNYPIVNALQKAYPMVPFQKERICLLPGAPPEGDWP